MTQREDILRIFPERMRPRWKKTAGFAQQLQEIRLRVGKPVLLYIDGREFFQEESGDVVYRTDRPAVTAQEDLDQLIAYACSYSMYAFEEEISRGYLTLPGGHRMGLTGKLC